MDQVHHKRIVGVLVLAMAISCNASQTASTLCTDAQREVIAAKLKLVSQEECFAGPRNCTCLAMLMPQDNATHFLNCEWGVGDNQTLWDHWEYCKQELKCGCTGNMGFYQAGPHIAPDGRLMPGYSFPKDFGNHCATNYHYGIDSSKPWGRQPWCYIPCDTRQCPHVPRYAALGQLGELARTYGQSLCFSFEACGGIDYLAASQYRCNQRGGYLVQERCSCDIGMPCTPDGYPTTTSTPGDVLWGKYFTLILVAAIVTGITLIILSTVLATYCSKRKKESSNHGKGDSNTLALEPSLKMPLLQLQDGLDNLVQTLQASDFMYGDNDIRLGPRIGGGAAGQVYAGYLASEDTGEANVALKESFQGFLEQDITEILHEVNVLTKLKHRNIVQLYGLWTSKDSDLAGIRRVYMVMELCEGGSLRQRIVRGGSTLTQKLRWACDIADGVHYLHSRKPCVVHRDLKPANIVLTRGGERAKLVDFGASRALTAMNGPMTTMIGTVAFMAPELMHKAADTEATPGANGGVAVDIYSFAVLLCQLWTDREPYSGLSPREIMVAVTLHNKRPSLEIASNNCDTSTEGGDDPRVMVHSTLCELIERMWVAEPADRPDSMVVSKSLHSMSTAVATDQTVEEM